MFESFSKKFTERISNLEKEAMDDLMDYLYDIKDEFPDVDISKDTWANNKCFQIEIKFKVSDLEKFKNLFHEGIFDRIKDDHIGTEIIYSVSLEWYSNESNSWGNSFMSSKSIKLSNPLDDYPNYSMDINSLLNAMDKNKVIETKSSTPLFNIQIHII